MPAGLGSLVASAVLAANTVCTVTINSTNEREAVRTAFPKAQVVELTDYSPADRTNSTDWMGGACQAGIQCDVLVVSGHFANKFFGETGFELPLRALEQQSCQNLCDGVLKRPSLVFLFGCNTLASKAPDRRSPRQYRNILLEDGLDPAFADRVVAFRYGPLGNETRTRMQKVFGDHALVFGFSSTAPVGEIAGPMFRRYLEQQRVPMQSAVGNDTRAARSRAVLASGWKQTFARFTPAVATGGMDFTVDECRFFDPRTSRLEKLVSAERMVAETPLQSAIRVYDFLRDEHDWDPQEQLVLSKIEKNRAARDDIMKALPRLTDAYETYFSMLHLARIVNWIDEPELRRLQDQRLSAMLRDGVTLEEKDFFCAHELTYEPPPALLADNRGSVNFISTLPCLSARGEATRAFLQAQASHASERVKTAALDALASLRLLRVEDVPRLLAVYRASRGELKSSALVALAAADGSDVRIQRLIADAVLDADEDLAWTAAQLLRQLKTTDVEVVRSLASGLASHDGFLRRSIAMVLKALAPTDAEILEMLAPYRDDADAVVKSAIAAILAPRR